MTKKLEETFNLPSMDEPIEVDDTNLIEPVADNIDELSAALAHVDKIDQALTPVKNLELYLHNSLFIGVTLIIGFQLIYKLYRSLQ